MSAIGLDQASGLRARVAGSQPPPVPVLYADFVLFRGAQVQLPPTTLVWHWRPRVAPAVGWDLQSRLHVVGSPAQFDLAEYQRWRALFPQWRLVGRRLELLHIADVACLWLTTGVELTPRLQILLGWLSRNRPQMPIILAGIGQRRRAATPAMGAFQVSFGVPHGGSGKSTGQPACRRLRTADPVGDGVPACCCRT
jgi:hypothetical protein